MSVFKLVNETKAKGKVKKVFNDIKKTRNIKKIPNFWKAIANNPQTLERTWNNLKQIMRKGALDSVTKELIYVACLLYTSPSPRDGLLSRMPSSA